NADPVQMHVDGESGRCRVIRQAPLLEADLREIHSAAAELFGHVDGQISGVAELLKILREETPGTIVFRSALGESLQHVVGKHGHESAIYINRASLRHRT